MKTLAWCTINQGISMPLNITEDLSNINKNERKNQQGEEIKKRTFQAVFQNTVLISNLLKKK